MADNTILDPGTGGDTIATDDVSGVKYQRVKLTDGTADSSTAIASGGGVESGALRVTVASDSTGVLSVDDNGGTLSVDDGGGSLTVDATSLPLPTGASTAAKQPALGTAGSASADVLTVQGIASMTALKVDGSAVTQPVSDGGGSLTVDGSVTVTGTVTANAGTGTMGVKLQPQTSGGLSAAVNVDIDETEDAVKTSAGQLFGWYLYNDGAAEVYVKFYNDTVANVSVGTTAPAVTLPIPAGSAANVLHDTGIAFSSAITIAATTGAATSDTGAPATNQVVGTIFYS